LNSKSKGKSKEQTLNLKQFQLANLLDSNPSSEIPSIPQSLSHSEEQRKLQEEARKAFHVSDDESDDEEMDEQEDEDGKEGFLSVKKKSKSEAEQEEDEFKQFILDGLGIETREEKKMLEELKGFIGGIGGETPVLDDTERKDDDIFLAKYVCFI
jgi:hypothetical protein